MPNPTRILILGGSGLIGHKLLQRLSRRFTDVWVTLRGQPSEYSTLKFLPKDRTLYGVDVLSADTLEQNLDQAKPDVLINCIGLTKRHLKDSGDAAGISRMVRLNSDLPHRLAAWARSHEARVIQLSTDCVFDGKKGRYSETDVPNASDLYGRTKALGELSAAEGRCLTIRSSFIGRELFYKTELVEWLLSEKGKKIKGFRQAIYSGLASWVLADLVGDLIEKHPDLMGLYHVASDPINKYDLLCRLKDAFDLDVEIAPDDTFVCKRDLAGGRLREATGFVSPPWTEMVKGIANDY